MKKLVERMKFYKMLRAPSMSLEEKMDELFDLLEEDLNILLKQFKADEDYKICQAIKETFEKRS